MVSFVTIHRGNTTRESKVIAVSADPSLVAEVATRLLEEDRPLANADPVLNSVQRGRDMALRLIRMEANHAD